MTRKLLKINLQLIPSMKHSYTISTLQFTGRGTKPNLNFVRVEEAGFPIKTESKKLGSPIFYKSSTVQKHKRKLRSAKEAKLRFSEENIKKSKAKFYADSTRVWPFVEDANQKLDTEEGKSNPDPFQITGGIKRPNLQILEEENSLYEEHNPSPKSRYKSEKSVMNVTVHKRFLT